MSTKAIREMVATYGRSMSLIQAKRLKAEVLAEVEAIERAAKSLTDPVDTKTLMVSRDVMRLMDSIVKDAP